MPLIEVSNEEAFGRALRTLRKKRGLDQEALALESKLWQSSISRYERGCGGPSFNSLIRVCAALGVLPSQLLAEAGL